MALSLIMRSDLVRRGGPPQGDSLTTGVRFGESDSRHGDRLPDVTIEIAPAGEPAGVYYRLAPFRMTL